MEGIRAGSVVLQDVYVWRRGAHEAVQAGGTMPAIMRLLEERDGRVDPRVFAGLGLRSAEPPTVQSAGVSGDPRVPVAGARRPIPRRSWGLGDLGAVMAVGWPGSVRRLGTILE